MFLFCFVCIIKIPLSSAIMSHPTPRSSTVKNFPVSNIGAFDFGSVLNRHASIVKKIKKKTQKSSNSKKLSPSSPKQLLCLGFSAIQQEKRERSRGKVRTNTIFQSKNWGNMK